MKKPSAGVLTLLLLIAISCSRSPKPSVPVKVSEDQARKIVAWYAVGNHAYGLELPEGKRVVRNGVLMYFVQVSGLGDGKVLKYFVDSSTADILKGDFSIEKSGTDIPGELTGLQSAQAAPATESFVMGMWKSIDLYASEDGSQKSEGTPLDRWTFLGSSANKYPTDRVESLGDSGKWGKRIKVGLDGDKVAWVDAPQVWLSAALAQKDMPDLGLDGAVGSDVIFGSEAETLDFVVEPVQYESDRDASDDHVLASPVLIDSKDRPYPLIVGDSLVRKDLDYDIEGFGLFHRTVMDTLTLALLPGHLKLGLDSVRDAGDGEVAITWSVAGDGQSAEYPSSLLTTVVRRETANDGSLSFTVLRIDRAEQEGGSGDLEGSWRSGSGDDAELYSFHGDSVDYYLHGRLESSGTWKASGGAIEMKIFGATSEYEYSLTGDTLILGSGKSSTIYTRESGE
jgi:hypothetical protein